MLCTVDFSQARGGRFSQNCVGTGTLAGQGAAPQQGHLTAQHHAERYGTVVESTDSKC